MSSEKFNFNSKEFKEAVNSQNRVAEDASTTMKNFLYKKEEVYTKEIDDISNFLAAKEKLHRLDNEIDSLIREQNKRDVSREIAQKHQEITKLENKIHDLKVQNEILIQADIDEIEKKLQILVDKTEQIIGVESAQVDKPSSHKRLN
jgi:flagellar biosynthesis/type III secretory pathway chaperone